MTHRPAGTDRRAIPQRSQSWATRTADLLYDAKLTPNAISVFSVVLAIIAAVCLVGSGGQNIALLIIAAICLPLRLLMNMLDGMLAVEKGMHSPTGDLYNEVPDRIADLVILAGAGYASAGAWMAGGHDLGVLAGWSAASLAVLTAYVRSLGAANGVKNFFNGPMPKPIRMWLLMVGLLVQAALSGFGYGPWAIIVALLLIALGSLLTVIIRLRLIAAAMRRQQ